MQTDKLKTFVCKDTGVVLKIQNVGSALVSQLRRDFPPPQPPMQEVDYGDGNKKMEPNSAAPEYIEALTRYAADFEDKLQRLVIKRGVVLTLTEEQKQEIQDLRDFYRTEYDREIAFDDKMAYILMIAGGTDDGLAELVNAIVRRSQPVEEDVQAALDTFQN